MFTFNRSQPHIFTCEAMCRYWNRLLWVASEKIECTQPTRAPIFVTNTNGRRKTVFYSLLFWYVIFAMALPTIRLLCDCVRGRTLWIFAVNSINSTLSALVEKMSLFFFFLLFFLSFLVSSTFILWNATWIDMETHAHKMEKIFCH